MPSWADLARGNSPKPLPNTTTQHGHPSNTNGAAALRLPTADDDGWEAYNPADFGEDVVSHNKNNNDEKDHRTSDDGVSSSDHAHGGADDESSSAITSGSHSTSAPIAIVVGGGRNTATTSSSSTPQPLSVPRGEGLLRSQAGPISADCWAIILSYCSHGTIIAASHTCVTLRRMAMRPQLWKDISENFTTHFMLDVGHDVPEMEFSFPVEMSAVIQKRRAAVSSNNTTHAVTAGGYADDGYYYDDDDEGYGDDYYNNDAGNYSSKQVSAYAANTSGGGGVVVTDTNTAAAEFIRMSRFLTRNEHRLWHLKEIRKTIPVIVNKSLKMGHVTSYDETSPSLRMGIPITVHTITDRRHCNGPYLRPSDISTVFSHQAANAMGACRMKVDDITQSFSDLFLKRLGAALGTQSLHKEMGRILVSAALVEISLQEAVSCIEGYGLPSNTKTFCANNSNNGGSVFGAGPDGRRAATGRGSFAPPRGNNTSSRQNSNASFDHHSYFYTMEMLLGDITIDPNETRYFAIRQLSTEGAIGIVFVDPLLTLAMAAGTATIHA